MNKSPKITASELVLSAIFFLQQKNGVTATEITKFICDKRQCKAREVKGQVKKALDRAIKNGIFSRKRGLYRIENGFGEKLGTLKDEQQGMGRRRRRRERPRRLKNPAREKKNNLKHYDFGEGSGSLENKIYQAGKFCENLFPFQTDCRKDVLDYETRLSSSDSKADNVSLKEVKKAVKKDNDELEDEDFTDEDEDDDDDIDYFAEENDSRPKKAVSADWGRKESFITERNYSSDSESDEKSGTKKRKATRSSGRSSKRKRREGTGGPKDDDDDDDDDDEEDSRTRKRVSKDKKKKMFDGKRKKGGRKARKDNRASENNFDSEDDSKGSDENNETNEENKESDNNFDSENEKSEKREENDSRGGENLKNSDNRGTVPGARRSEENNVKDLIKSNNDFPKQSKDEFKSEIQENEQKVTQKEDQKDIPLNDENPAAGPPCDAKIKDSEENAKDISGEPSPSTEQPSPNPESVPTKEGGYSRSSKRDAAVKLLRSSKKRSGGKKKNISGSRSVKRSRCK